MAIDYHIHHEDEFLSIRIGDRVDLTQVYELGQSVLKDPAFPPHWPQLVDLRGMRLELAPEALQPFVQYLLNRYRPEVKGTIAVVLDGDAEDEVLAGAYRLACNLPATEVFDDYGQALTWLLCPPPITAARELRRSAS